MPKKQTTVSSGQAAGSQGESLERKRLTSLINSMADGVIALNEEGKIVLYNGAALNILNVNTSIQDRPLKNVINLYDKKDQPIDITKVVNETNRQFSGRDWLIKYGDGSKANLFFSIAPVKLGFGNEGVQGYVVLLRDITREKSLEEERDEFISVISHELRTPVAIAEGNISNASYIFNKSNISDDSLKNALRQAHDQIDYLSNLINDLATLSRAEGGGLKLEVAPINTTELCQDLIHNYEPQAVAKGLKLKSDLDPNLEILYSSKLYVREILQNFITNAIKYTEEGSVTLGAKAKENGVQFFVSDTGIGISKTDQTRVFDKFFRSEDFRTKQSKGTGLGLYVTTKLIKLLNAKVSLESELNKGSVFTVFIPNLQKP